MSYMAKRVWMETLLTEDKMMPIISHCLKKPNGQFGEVGVFNGGFTCILSDNFIDSKIYAYDTFEGMPESCWQHGEPHQVGEFKSQLHGWLQYDVVKILNNRRNVIPRKGIFPESIREETGFWMVHLDVDFYLSTLNSLKVLVNRMEKGGAIFLDDWDWIHCPGVRQAVEELGLSATQTAQHQAVIEF